MSKLYYWHILPSEKGEKPKEYESDTALPYDHAGTGRFADCIYHSRNSNARFYVVVCGYEIGWSRPAFSKQNDRYILHFIINGKGFFNGKPVKKGDICVALPHQSYSIQHHERDPMTYGWISLAGKELELMIEILHLPKATDLPLSTQQIDEVNELFLETLYQKRSKDHLPYFLLSQLFRLLTLAQIPYIPPMNTNNIYVDHALRYINAHYAENISVSDIANALSISVSHLRNVFSAEIHDSPQAMLINKRIAVATALMKSETPLSIREIAEACGYLDQGSFSRRFKKQIGMSPLEYQKACKQQNKKNNVK